MIASCLIVEYFGGEKIGIVNGLVEAIYTEWSVSLFENRKSIDWKEGPVIIFKSVRFESG